MNVLGMGVRNPVEVAKACAEAGIAFSNDDAHSAAYDAERTAELFCEIVNRWKESGGWMPEFG